MAVKPVWQGPGGSARCEAFCGPRRAGRGGLVSRFRGVSRASHRNPAGGADGMSPKQQRGTPAQQPRRSCGQRGVLGSRPGECVLELDAASCEVSPVPREAPAQ
jgi:hypothetical protein